MKYSIFILLLMIICPLIEPMDWPLSYALLTDNFGKNKGGIPVLGMSFAAEGVITAADAGDLLFVHKESHKASRLPSPLGTWFAVDQGNGMVGIYSRLADEDIQALPHRIEQGTALASTGRTGFSEQEGFHFSLYDRKERQWVNPVKFAPLLPDSRLPVIQQVQLRNSDGESFVITPRQRIAQGRWTICVTVADFVDNNEHALAPHSIALLFNGRELSRLNLETIVTHKGILMMECSGLVPAENVYSPVPGFELGTVQLTRGQTSLEIAARDSKGNSRNALFELLVE
ncbi:MAG: hypothetical protein LBO67_07995 [Spirochaetaceae bacterium]|jgi:hypothetical protein|nr:hypothetical protein [Spirochaetaceae bacterium]